MATKHQLMQRIIRRYKDETGITEVDMIKVVEWAVSKNLLKPPKPKDPIRELVKEFSRAAREEIRYDEQTGMPYRANHSITVPQGQEQLHLWIDIDEAPRKPMVKSLIMRREQMVGDGLQLTLDQDHWNRIHPDEEPINLPMDLTDDIEWRKNAPKEHKKTG